jgi:N-acetylmuramoyl-L-alanine amidase
VVASYRGAEPGQSTERAVANSDGDFSLGRQLGLGVSRIVIDPGHGGYDPGAQTGGLTESALVLDVATRLAARLKAETDIEVILTRRRDAYMPLRARTELANRVGADLFLSIHANAARDHTARGIETYYLDLATTADTQMVAARENAASRDGMHDLSELVQSITLHNKLDESRDLAEIVQRHLVRAVRELHPDAQDLGVKQAPFVVLIGANMPSVLAEISFLTNQEDAAFLATDAYRNKIAEALLQSILEYQRTLKPETNFVAGNN